MTRHPFHPAALPTPADYYRAIPKRRLRVLVGCEYSGRVRDAFNAAGHDAISCDILPTDSPGPHRQGDLLELLQKPWDLIIAFPPCRYLATSQAFRCNPKHDPDGVRAHHREAALEFVAAIMNAPHCERIAIENSVGCIGKRIEWDEDAGLYLVRDFHEAREDKRTPSPVAQSFNPYNFGHAEQKRTCLWLKGLPKLRHTNTLDIEEHGYFHEGEQVWRWQNQTGKGYNKLGENSTGTRWKLRSLTYSGVSDAMADQWG